jgi:hypothetical protein
VRNFLKQRASIQSIAALFAEADGNNVHTLKYVGQYGHQDAQTRL